MSRGLFADEYGTRPWVLITVVVAIVLLVTGGILAAGAAGLLDDSSSPDTALVLSKQTGWQDGQMVYYMVLGNGIRQRVGYTAWNSAQPGRSYSSYTARPGANPLDEEELDAPSITRVSTQYSIPQSSVRSAARPVSVPIEEP